MTAVLTAGQLAALKRAVASGYIATVEANAKGMTAPFWWYGALSPGVGHDLARGGTMCFVHTGERLLGVSAEHVHAECVAALRVGRGVSCQVGSHTFDPERCLIDSDSKLDLVTYGLTEIQVNAAGGNTHGALKWPPEVDEGDAYIVGGWPWSLTEQGPSTATHRFLNFIARLSTASDQKLGIVTGTSTSIPWGRNALPPGTNLGGMSGGPVYRMSERGPLAVMTLVGIVFEYEPAFEIALARPLSLLEPDGTIRRQASW